MEDIIEDEYVYVILKSVNFFRKHSYEDMDGGFWGLETLRDNYNQEEVNEMPWVFVNTDGRVIYSKSIIRVSTEKLKYKMWAIETVLDRKNYPEYYL